MTITEEQKQKIISLYQKGINKKDISRITTVSYPSVRRILDESEINDDSGNLQEKAEQTKKTLTEIFNYENYTEESVLELVYNLKRIAKESGKDLGAFVEDLSYIFDMYYKHSPNPIKLFDFLLGISEHLSLIYDNIEPKAFNEIVELYYNKGIFIKDADEYLADIEEKTDLLLANSKEIWDDCQKRIENAKKKAISEVESKSETLLKNSKQDLKEYQKKIDNAQKELASLILNQAVVINRDKTENQALKEILEQTDKENSLLKIILQRITAVFPNEIESIWSEIQNEQK